MTAGGIVLPDTAKEKPQRGTVVAVGPGKLLDSGERGKLSVTVGDEVIYGKYSGTDVEVDGREVKILRETGHPRQGRQVRQNRTSEVDTDSQDDIQRTSA